jgi:hypothetical protein
LRHPINDSQEIGAFVGAVHRQSPPVAAIPQICEETGAIFIKMQKSPAFDVKYSWSPLNEVRPGPKARQQIVQRV